MTRVYLSGNAASDGQRLAFPLGNQERRAAMKIGDGGTVRIEDVTGTLEGLKAHLKGMPLQSEQGIRELEFLDRHMEGMTEKEKAVFRAALDIESPNSMAEIVNLSCNLDKFRLFDDIKGHEELGRNLLGKEEVPERLVPFLDYGAAGREYARNNGGRFTEKSYVIRTGEPLEQVYDGKYLPTPGYDRSCVIHASLYSPFYAAGHYHSYPVSLPASEERLALAVENLSVKGLDECRVLDIICPVRELEDFLPFSRDVKEMNELSRMLAEKGVLGDAGERGKLFAALEAEAPEDMAEAMRVIAELEQYTVLPEDIRSAVDYAHYYLEDAQIHIHEDVQPYLDYGKLGEYQMRKEGVVQTEYGLVLRRDRPIAQLTEELEELKLFSPLSGILYPYDGDWGGVSDQPMKMDSGDLCQYEDQILERIGQEHLEEEGERGLAVYLRNHLLKRKVFSMNPSVEMWSGKLWGVLEVKSRGPLSPQELAGLTEEWQGQESDGWGEGFEQREIKTEEGDICVSFWHSGDDFFIKTEQELKQWQTQDLSMQMGGNG